MSLKRRITRLEGNQSGVSVVIERRNFSEAERAKVAEDHRRANGLPPDAPVLVFSGDDAEL